MKYTKYEQARIVGTRALQISQGAPLLIKFSEKDFENMRYSPLEIAKLEYKEGLIPIDVKRKEIEPKEKGLHGKD